MTNRTVFSAFDWMAAAAVAGPPRVKDEPTVTVVSVPRPGVPEDAHLESLVQLSRIIELRDDKTGEHIARVARLSGLIAQHLHMTPEEIRRVHRVAPVHDIGKVVVPDKILLKPGPLTEEEQEKMRSHTTLATEILQGSASDLIRTAEQVARHHHERWDGHGYPDGLAGEEIPLAARIVAVADTFDAMIHDRPYRMAVPIREVREVLARESGWQLDPQVVEALFRVLDSRGESMVVPRPPYIATTL